MLFYFLSTKNNNIFTCISKPQDVMEDSSEMRKEIGWKDFIVGFQAA